MEQLVRRDPQDQKEKRDKKARGCVVSSTCDGAGQAVVEMLRLCTPVSAFCIKEIKKNSLKQFIGTVLKKNLEHEKNFLKIEVE